PGLVSPEYFQGLPIALGSRNQHRIDSLGFCMKRHKSLHNGAIFLTSQLGNHSKCCTLVSGTHQRYLEHCRRTVGPCQNSQCKQQPPGVSFATTALRHNAMLKVFRESGRRNATHLSPFCVSTEEGYEHFRILDAIPRILFRLNFIPLLADDKTSRVRDRKRRRAEEPCDRNCVVISPGGSAGEKPTAAREWHGDGAWLGGSLEELQQFRNCFPFFCSLNCFPRSTVLCEAPPPTPCRSTDHRTLRPFPLHPFCPLDAKASLRYTTNFSLLSLFRRRTKQQRRPSRSPEKASFSFQLERTEW
ncbi:hypothetical protein ALC62_11719, partial [Cyphomyrmex costatus]